MNRAQLTCIHRGDRLETRGTCNQCSRTVEVPLFQCNKFDAPCSTALQTKEGHRLCKTCPAREAPTVAAQAPPPSPPTATPSRTVVVPQPPPLSLSPTSTRAVVTVAVGDEGRLLLASSGPLMKAYARRLGADFVVLDWPGDSDWPMSAKFAIPRVLEHYQRIAYVDADVILRPGCLDLFSLCEPFEFGACDELPWHRWQLRGDREKEYKAFRREMGFREVSDLPWYLNCGVFVASREHARYLMPPLRPIRVHHCAEQDHTNAGILDAYLDGKVKVRLLDRRANWQSWQDHWGFKGATDDAILHLSGGGKERQFRKDRLAEMTARFQTADQWPSYIICSTQRSGSTLLAKALEDAGLGRPGELLSEEDAAPKTLDAIRENRCAKIHWFQMAKYGLESSPILSPGGKYIAVTRRDMVRQAISLSRALQTMAWTFDRPAKGATRYDRGHILKCLSINAVDLSGWEAYYRRHGITPLRIAYEDLESDYTGTVRRVLDWLGEYDRPVPPPRLQKQADAINGEWVDRFLRGE